MNKITTQSLLHFIQILKKDLIDVKFFIEEIK